MIGGLEKDEWGHPAVIFLLFFLLLDLIFPSLHLSFSDPILLQSGNQSYINLHKLHFPTGH